MRVLTSAALALTLLFSGEASGQTFSRERTHERPNLNARDGRTLPGSRTTVNGASRNSDPVVAQNSAGRNYDKRNGRLMSDSQAADANDRAGAYETPEGVTLASWETGEGEAGLNAGPFENGRANILGGGPDDPGRLSIDVLRASGEGSASIIALPNGYGATAELKGQVTLIGISGEIEGQYGDDMNNIRGGASGQAYIGAEGELSGSAQITTDGVQANGKAGAFIGGKAEGEITGGFTICGISIEAKGTGEASYGIGAEAEGYFKVNWATMTVKIGGKAALTFGGGAGVGGEVEISLAELMKDPAAAAMCAWDKIKEAGEWVLRTGGELVDGAVQLASDGIEVLSNAADAVTGFVSDVGSTIGQGLSDGASAVGCFFFGCDEDEPPAPPRRAVATSNFGNNTGRFAPTAATAGSYGNGGRASEGVGISR